jgi:arylsulfatase
MQEVFAGFLEHVDAQVGRLVDALDGMGLRDDTLIIYMVGDNGPSGEGSLTGTLNNMKTQLGLLDDVPTMLEAHARDRRTTAREPLSGRLVLGRVVAVPVDEAGASHFGGTRNGLVVSWPKGINRPRWPALAVPPRHRPGADDSGGRGHSRAARSERRAAKNRSRASAWPTASRTRQRRAGGPPSTSRCSAIARSITTAGSPAACMAGCPWLTAGGASFDERQLGALPHRRGLLAGRRPGGQEPQKLRELQDRFMAEAAKYNVLPLDDRFAQRADPKLHPSHIRGKTQFVYRARHRPARRALAPNTKNVHHTLAAEVEIPEAAPRACSSAAAASPAASRSSSRTASFTGSTTTTTRCTTACRRRDDSAGHHVLSAEVKVDKEGKFGTAERDLRLGRRRSARAASSKQVAGYFTVNETFDVGCDTVSPVSDCTSRRSRFTGTMIKVMVDVSEATFEELAEQHEARARIAMATQ